MASVRAATCASSFSIRAGSCSSSRCCFQASFFAGAGGGGLASRAGRADLQVFRDVAAALEAQHGAPAGSTQRDEPFERRRLHWQVADTQLALLLLQVGDASLVKVIYQVQPPDAPPPVRLRSGG